MSLKTTFREEEVAQLRSQQAEARVAGRHSLAEGAGWMPAPVDPAAIVRCFSALSVAPDYRLIAFSYRQGTDREGVVWALPRAAAPPLLDRPMQERPRPEGAIDPMAAIEGETVLGHATPWAYLSASFLRREFDHFGQPCQELEWGDQTLLLANPWARGGPDRVWLEDEPTEWRPRVEEDTNRKFVQIFTLRGGPEGEIVCQRDRFRSEGFEIQAAERVVARGPGWSGTA